MRPIIVLLAAHLIATNLPAQQLAGEWTGYWSRAGDAMPVTMRVQTAPAGGLTATFDSDRLRVSGIPFAQVQVEGCCDVTLTLRGDRTTTVFTGTLRGDSLTGTLREGSSEGRFAYSRVASPAPLFDESAVTFSNGGVTLAGTLLLPRTGGALAAVVFLHGSGAEGRWASRFLASQMATHGIAALIYDKRGVGASTGDWRTANLEDLAGDARAAVERIAQESRVDRKRIGIHGHSQGGTIAPLVGARAPGVGFIIASAAAGTPTDSTEIFSMANSMLAGAKSAQDSASMRGYIAEMVDVAYNGAPHAGLEAMSAAIRDRSWYFAPPAPDNSYWTFSKVFGAYRPLDWWARTRVPVLLIYGGDDQRVPAAESAARISGTLLRAGNGDVSVSIFPGADHTFRDPPGASGWPVTAPGYVQRLLDWVSRR